MVWALDACNKMDIVWWKGRPFARFAHAMGGGDDTIRRDQRARAVFRPAVACNIDLPNSVPSRIVIDNADAIVIADDTWASVSTLDIGDVEHDETAE